MRIVQTPELLVYSLYSALRRSCEDSPSWKSVLVTAFPAGKMVLKVQNICKHLTFSHDTWQFTSVGHGPAVLLEQGPPDELSLPPPPAGLVPNYLMLRRIHMHLRTVLLLLRPKSIVYIVTHLKTGTRSKMNINPASSAASEWLCFYSRWRTEELSIHFLGFEFCLVNK